MAKYIADSFALQSWQSGLSDTLDISCEIAGNTYVVGKLKKNSDGTVTGTFDASAVPEEHRQEAWAFLETFKRD